MPAEKVAQTPNILIMMVDQMRWDALHCAGNPYIQTPNLDRLAAEGVRFTRAYSPVPVCIPARHGMLTGQRCAVHQRTENMVPNPEPQLPYLAELLGLAGYRTHAIGKMHFRPVRRHYGFQRMELMEEIPDWRADDEYLQYLQAHGYGDVREVHGIRNLLYHLPQVSLIPEEHHGSTWVADRTVRFLIENGNRPFFLFSSWIAPHPPWNPPEPYASMYDPDALPLPVGWDDERNLPPSLRRQARYPDVKDASPQLLRRIKALYYGSITLIDKGVGRILDTLDELGLSENTLVIFTSDHGEMLGDHHMFQKSNPYEPSAHIPLLARFPGRLEAGRVCDDLVSLLDVMPTALDLAKAQYPGSKPLAGASLLGREGGGLAEKRDNLVIEFGHGESRWLSLRQGDWRYTYYLAEGYQELFHLGEDPHELRNLLRNGRAEHRQLAEAMKAYLTAWEQRNGFASSIDSRGQLVSTKPRRVPAAMPVNNQFPRWVERLTPEEKAQMRGIGESLLAAMAHETTYTLADLKRSGSLDQWKAMGGTLAGTNQAHLLGEETVSEQSS